MHFRYKIVIFRSFIWFYFSLCYLASLYSFLLYILNYTQVINGVLISLSANSITSTIFRSVFISWVFPYWMIFFLFMGHIFLLLHMFNNFWLVIRVYQFNLVEFKIWFYFYKEYLKVPFFEKTCRKVRGKTTSVNLHTYAGIMK